MPRKTKVVGFSLPPTIHQKLEKIIKQKHKTRSEFMREMIDVYFNSIKQPSEAHSINLGETNFAKILRTYWELKSSTQLQTIIVGLAIIINNKGKVLIGARSTKDEWVENLTWVFPGGRFENLNFEKNLQETTKEITNLNISVDSLISARIHPDAGFKDVQIVALYFHCKLNDNEKEKPNGKLKKLKWVKPNDVFKYFTTSTNDEVTRFLTTIQKSS